MPRRVDINQSCSPLAATARSGEIETAIVLVCTRDRPRLLAECLASLSDLETGEGLEVLVAVADNNAAAQEKAIRAAAAAHGLDILYAHEPERGYASIRNAALNLAREAAADVAIFIDDDSRADPRLVTAHVAALRGYQADAILGRIDGLSRRPQEGRRVTKAGCGNVSVRRRVYADPPDGLGLRFDERLNLLGQEDREFFADLIRLGGSIRQSCHPVVLNSKEDEANPACAGRPLSHRLIFATMEGRNETVVIRKRHGIGQALVVIARRQMPQAARAIIEAFTALMLRPVNADLAASKLAQTRVRFAKISAAITGLWRPGYERQAARRGELVELAPTLLTSPPTTAARRPPPASAQSPSAPVKHTVDTAET